MNHLHNTPDGVLNSALGYEVLVANFHLKCK
jgi:hypothetical protein